MPPSARSGGTTVLLAGGVENADKVNEINIEHKNKYCFPNKHLTETLQASSEKEIIKDADIILVALPSSVIIETLITLKPFFKKSILFINLSKGLLK